MPFMVMFQRQFALPALPRGFHLIDRHVIKALPELSQLKVGLAHLFLMHTSASLMINENADPDVREDLETAFNAVVPESFPYTHTVEGSDDMPAHIKGAMIGTSVTVPVRDGGILLGTWQGIYLCEHRNHGGPRRIVATLHGE